MGINCVGVTKIFHYGPPQDLDSYIQETGRGGREGQDFMAALLWSPLLNVHSDDAMVDYCLNTTKCRRDVMFSNYDNYTNNARSLCNCCDVCSIVCECAHCITID